MAAHKHSWKYSPGAEHRACECGADQTLQAQQDTCGLRHWGPTMGYGEEGDAVRRYFGNKLANDGNLAGRFRFIGNSMIPAGEYVAAKYYDEAMATIAKMRRVLGAVDKLMDDLINETERHEAEQNASGRGLPPSSDGA